MDDSFEEPIEEEDEPLNDGTQKLSYLLTMKISPKKNLMMEKDVISPDKNRSPLYKSQPLRNKSLPAKVIYDEKESFINNTDEFIENSVMSPIKNRI